VLSVYEGSEDKVERYKVPDYLSRGPRHGAQGTDMKHGMLTQVEKPRYKGRCSWEIPRWGRSQERSKDQNPSIVLT